jgi:hypothetical protein
MHQDGNVWRITYKAGMGRTYEAHIPPYISVHIIRMERTVN